jgi:hypothetical protein
MLQFTHLYDCLAYSNRLTLHGLWQKEHWLMKFSPLDGHQFVLFVFGEVVNFGDVLVG